MRRTAKHCKTPHHSATHCHTLQHELLPHHGLCGHTELHPNHGLCGHIWHSPWPCPMWQCSTRQARAVPRHSSRTERHQTRSLGSTTRSRPRSRGRSCWAAARVLPRVFILCYVKSHLSRFQKCHQSKPVGFTSSHEKK